MSQPDSATAVAAAAPAQFESYYADDAGHPSSTAHLEGGGGGGGGGGWAQQQPDEGGDGTSSYATAAEAAAYSPAEYLQQLEAHLGSLQQQRRGLQQQLSSAAAAAYQAMSGRLGAASTSVPLPADVAALAGEVEVLQSARQYLSYIQELQALARHLEKAVRTLQQEQQAQQVDGAAFLQSLSEAVESYSGAMGYAIAVRQLGDAGKVPAQRLKQYAGGLLARVEAARDALRALLSAAIQQRLAQACWPPPMAVSGGGGAAGAAPESDDWPGFAASCGEGVAAELQQLLVALLTLQRASQHEQFSALAAAAAEVPEGSPIQEGPLLWIAEELATPLAERLRRHFASGLPTDRPDRPEWLFATATKAAQQCGPLVQELHSCIEMHQLQGWYSLPLELARAVQVVGVNALLAEHLLPQLVTGGDPALWLHFADEAIQFERRYAPLRGASLALPDDDGEPLAASHGASTLDLLFQNQQWQARTQLRSSADPLPEGWLGAEQWDAIRQLESACDAYTAWQPAANQMLDAMEGQGAAAGGTARGGASEPAWRHEFRPPTCVEQAAALVGGLVRRGGWVHSQEHRLKFMQAVPLAVLRAFRERIGGLLTQAEQFRGLLGDNWLPRVGAAVCAAHYIEHTLREPQGMMLVAELQDSAAVVAAAGAAGQQQQQEQQQGAARGLAPRLEREAAAAAALRKQWSYKLAQQAVERFNQLFVPYKRDVAAFTAGYEEGSPPEAAAAAAAAAGPAAPSPAMLQAADSLQQLLRVLAQHLDAVAFRDVWRSVALAVNTALYNDVATEALFSAQGACQLDADLAAMSAIFGEYTSRPAAHFKESHEACRLLGLPHAQAVQLLAALQSAAAQPPRESLTPLGVKCLNAEQAAVVLQQRLDVLTSRGGGGGGGGAV